METKKHYRKVFKSDHLGVADLEDLIESKHNLIFKVKEVKQELNIKVAGRSGNFNIAYFHENLKPLVLNVTNCKVMQSICDNKPFVDDWKDVNVQLYIDPNVKMKGEIVGGVRIKKVVAPLGDISHAIESVTDERSLLSVWSKLSETDQKKHREEFSKKRKSLTS